MFEKLVVLAEDGVQSEVILIEGTNCHTEATMKEYLNNTTKCHRQELFKIFIMFEADDTIIVMYVLKELNVNHHVY